MFWRPLRARLYYKIISVQKIHLNKRVFGHYNECMNCMQTCSRFILFYSPQKPYHHIMEGMLMIDLAGGTLLYHKTFRCQMDKKKNSEYYMNMGAFMFALYTYSNSDDLVRTNTRSSASDGSPQDIHHDGMKVVSSGPPSLSRYQMNHKCFYFWEHRSPSISFLVVLIVNHIRVQDNHITPALATEIIQAQAVAFGQSYVPGQSIKVNRQMYHRECMSIIREMAYGLLRQMSKSTDTGLDWIVILQPPHNLGSWSELVQQVHSSKARIEIPRLSKRFRWPSFAFLRYGRRVRI